jgi:FimV-like protein
MDHRLLRFFQGLCLYIVTGILCAGAVNAVGLGRIKVYSYLNEPLDAEIELLAATNVVDSLLVSVASADEFERANVPRIPLLNKLMFQIIRDEDEIFIHATSKTWVTEPYLDFLLNLSWGSGASSGRLIRRYTILLDPIPPEGKPVYAKRRLMPNTIEQPSVAPRKRYAGGPTSVADLTAEALDEALAEKGVPLTVNGIPAGIAAQTPQEKLDKISKQNANSTVVSDTSNAENSAQRNNMQALFEHHDKPADLKTVIEDVERIIVSNRSPEAEKWFTEPRSSEKEAEVKTTTEVAPKPKPSQSKEAVKTDTAASAAQPTPSSVVPEIVATPVKKIRWQDYIGLMGTLVITIFALSFIIWKRWKQRRQFSATREKLAKLSREAIDEERASASNETNLTPAEENLVFPTEAAQVGAVMDAPLMTSVAPAPPAPPPPPIVEEPVNMADLDALLADETPPPPEVALEVPEAPTPPSPSVPPAAPPPPVIEEIQINLDVTLPTATATADTEEINLKLQLARQYVELGDFGGAKELLTLVNTQGNAEQKKEAQELLEKIV